MVIMELSPFLSDCVAPHPPTPGSRLIVCPIVLIVRGLLKHHCSDFFVYFFAGGGGGLSRQFNASTQLCTKMAKVCLLRCFGDLKCSEEQPN